ncbi:Mbeg1-like protein [Streptococcus plurextorum]|uniref:Mbeg1-like protein n=1 Tax=Streptococcus plurextorum TaxID=456876 RepID=UPI0004112169|nr:Mbeg1-like protein [Streptococcus plurextorum]
MGTLIDYLKENGQTPFSQLPFNELDLVCLNELGYLPFGEHLEGHQRMRFSEIKTIYQEQKANIAYDFMVTRERIQLFEAVLDSLRFADLEIADYVNDVNSEFEKQFAAMVFYLPDIQHCQVVFRGTDDSLIGWKEDFKLTYMSEIPAQRSAVTYLRDVLESTEQSVCVTGHSKGGNLAVYAASHQEASRQAQIKLVMMLDAPGFSTAFFQKQGYQMIRDKLIVIRPKDSIVGVMLQLDVPALVVDAHSFGVSQHSVMTWKVSEQGYFMGAEPTALSNQLSGTFDQWMANLSKSELKMLVDLLFDTLIDSGIDNLNHLNQREGLGSLLVAFGKLNQIHRNKRQLIQKSLWQFLTAFAQNGHGNPISLRQPQAFLKSKVQRNQ